MKDMDTNVLIREIVLSEQVCKLLNEQLGHFILRRQGLYGTEYDLVEEDMRAAIEIRRDRGLMAKAEILRRTEEAQGGSATCSDKQ